MSLDLMQKDGKNSVNKLSFFTGSKIQSNFQIDPIVKVFQDEIMEEFKAKTGYELKLVRITDSLIFPALVLVAMKQGKPLSASVTYFTGTTPTATKTVEGYLQEFAEQVNNKSIKNNSIDILLHDNINNQYVIREIENKVEEELSDGNVENFLETFSIIGFYTLNICEELTLEQSKNIAYNLTDAILLNTFVESSLDKDLSMEFERNNNEKIDWSVNLDVNHESTSTGTDVFGHSYAKQITIRSKGSCQQVGNALGIMNSSSDIVNTSVNAIIDYRLDMLPETHDRNGNVVDAAKVIAIPEITFTNYHSARPSLSSFFLSVANAVQLFSDRNYAYAAHVSTIDKSNSVTNLNYFINVEGNETGHGSIPKSKNWSTEDIVGFLNTALNKDSIFSIKLDLSGVNSYFNNLLLMAAGGFGPQDKSHFNRLLLRACKRLTNGKFNYDGDVFNSVLVKYPIGTFTNSNGVNSLDLITTPDYISAIKGPELDDIVFNLNQMNSSPDNCISINGQRADSSVCVLDALNNANVKHGKITGIGYKLTFRPEFLIALVNAVNALNYYPNVYGPTIDANVTTRRTFSNNALGNTVAGGFQSRPFVGGNVFQTAFGNASFRHY